MKPRSFMPLTAALLLCGCATSGFETSWKAPDAVPLESQGARVGALVMMQDQATRRVAEDALAKEINTRGAQAVPGYTLLPDIKPANEAQAKAAFAAAGVQGVVVIRPISVDNQLVSTPVTYLEPSYRGYWDGYYGYGAGAAWGAVPVTAGVDLRTNTTLTIETLVYSLRQNKLVWAGQSKLHNPDDVVTEVRKLSAAVAKELQRQGLLKQ
jgi:hypothetical protein